MVERDEVDTEGKDHSDIDQSQTRQVTKGRIASHRCSKENTEGEEIAERAEDEHQHRIDLQEKDDGRVQISIFRIEESEIRLRRETADGTD